MKHWRNQCNPQLYKKAMILLKNKKILDEKGRCIIYYFGYTVTALGLKIKGRVLLSFLPFTSDKKVSLSFTLAVTCFVMIKNNIELFSVKGE
jgi:hypothetical protein